MSQIMDAKLLMSKMEIRELRILRAWISDEIAIKEKNKSLREEKNVPPIGPSREEMELLQHDIHSDDEYPSNKVGL